MKLHLGCFDQPVDGWYNTDITPHIFVSRIPYAATFLRYVGKISERRYNQHKMGVFRRLHYLNIAKQFPFPDNTAEAVFSSHIIEHVSPTVAKHMLAESLRVLSPGGVCRVVAPSLQMAISEYSESSPETTLGMIFEHQHENPKNRHQWMYTESSLVNLMESIGFKEVKKMSYKEGRLPDLELIDNRPENSIYVEGMK